MNRIVIIFFIILALFSCKENNLKVSKYYTTSEYDRNCPRIPLYPPLSLIKHYKNPNKWGITTQDLFVNETVKANFPLISIDSINMIGVNNSIVYGFCGKYIKFLRSYENGYFVTYNYKEDFIGVSKEKADLKGEESEIVIVDSVKKLVEVPARWFIIDTNQKTVNFFKDSSRYLSVLKELDVTSYLYDIDSIQNEFIKNEVLPWFPDVIKNKLESTKR